MQEKLLDYLLIVQKDNKPFLHYSNIKALSKNKDIFDITINNYESKGAFIHENINILSALKENYFKEKDCYSKFSIDLHSFYLLLLKIDRLYENITLPQNLMEKA